MKKAMESGTPINPPIWWLDPMDTESYAINDGMTFNFKILIFKIEKTLILSLLK